MSSIISVTRRRWAARSMIVSKWLVEREFRHAQPLCELLIDDLPEVVPATKLHPDDVGGIYWFYAAEGHEVPPSGVLLEYSDSGGGRGQLHSSARTPLVRRDVYPSLFLSYRRVDTDAYAGRLHESLTRELGPDEVFMDQFSIRPGEVFPWTIQQAAAHCRVMICLIGKEWSRVQDSRGRRRLDDERDYVRREIVAALDRGTIVIPVLAPGAEVPNPADLPDDLQGLEHLQFLELSARYWQADLEILLREVRRHLGPGK